MPGSLEVAGSGLVSVACVRRRRWIQQYDVWPFALLYSAVLGKLWHGPTDGALPQIDSAAELDPANADTDATAEWLAQYDLLWVVLLGIVALVHCVTLLAGFWSVRAKVGLRFFKVNADLAHYVLVHPTAVGGKAAICKVVRTKHKQADSKEAHEDREERETLDVALPEYSFVFQSEHFGWEDKERVVRKRAYPVRVALGSYLQWKGLTREEQVQRAEIKWGQNKFDIPMPGLGELFLEQALAPFFVFQVACVGIWCWDSYWYYSLYTLAMLVLFELIVCKTRQSNLGSLRAMGRPPYPVLVYRNLKWQQISSSQLLPGDLMSVIRPGTANAGNAKEEEERVMPCDVLLLDGNCIANEAMLTGESVPKVKESASEALINDPELANKCLELDNTEFASHIVLGGTKILMHTGPVKDSPTAAKLSVPPAPDGGCTCFVLRTGFGTSQGSLMRTILFSTERVTMNNAETYAFLGVLLAFALVASAYVWIEGIKDEKQSRWALLLRCILIITNVIPSELPMELSIAVNTSLSRLQELAIYCTEPYRIPLAGKVDVCCFDKTGTLTADVYDVLGIAENPDATNKLTAPTQVPLSTMAVIAGCHQLVRIGDSVEGDPMEQAAVLSVKWAMATNGKMVRYGSQERHELRIVHCYPFSSEAKRMSAIVQVDIFQHIAQTMPVKLLAVCKGAPEVVGALLKEKPAGYDAGFQKLMMSGARVLALAYRELPLKTSETKLKGLSRQQVEHDLVFGGFLVLRSPLKDDTVAVVEELRTAGHKVTIITGDNALTASDVAKKIGIVGDDMDKLLLLKSKPKLVWDGIDPERPLPNPLTYSKGSAKAAVDAGNFLVVTGASIDAIESQAASHDAFLDALKALTPHVAVFARVSPRNKEMILAALKAAGLGTLMCGDGTNDVGALKQADVGVSIVNAPEHEAHKRKAKETLERRYSKEALDKLTYSEMYWAEVSLMEANKKGSTMVQLGDASIASPFTSKTTSIRSAMHIVRHGRCTLITTIQMYKILALNCLITAYSMSALRLYGVKQSETQATAGGILIAMLFMFIAAAKPLELLSKQRPTTKVFSKAVIVSLAGQLVIHFATLFSTLYMTLMENESTGGMSTGNQTSGNFPEANATQSLTDGDEMVPDSEFEPNLLCTTMYLVVLIMQCNVFGVNYRGRPFMQSISENKPFLYMLLTIYIVCLIFTLDVFPEAGEYMQFTPIPTENGFKDKILGIMAVNTVGTWCWEALCRALL